MIMQSKKKVNTKKKFSNRLLYTFITLGILISVISGVFALDKTTEAWHSRSQIDFLDRFVLSDSSVTGNGGVVSIYGMTEGVGYHNLNYIGYQHIWKAGGAEAEFMRMNTIGNVGIGTPNPTEKLEVVGNVKATGLCIGTDCKTAWPTASGTGNICPEGAGVYYKHFNGVENSLEESEDTIGPVISSRETVDTCDGDTGTLLGLTALPSHACAPEDSKTCWDVNFVNSINDVYGSWNSTYILNTCNLWKSQETCVNYRASNAGNAYSCVLGEVKDCIDYRTGSAGACFIRVVNCRNSAQLVTCKRNMQVFCKD